MQHGKFPETLNALREAANLTNRELARRAEVPETLICGLQKGSRRVGEANARQIGEALGLDGEDLNQFILQAIDTCSEKVLKSAQGFPASLINFLALQFEKAGVLPELITDSTTEKDKLTLLLSDGRIARISAELTIS